MIKSMTGYGRAVLAAPGREITVEVKSVNNRYLDCSVRLPRTCTFAEDALRRLVKAQVARGKVDVFVSITATPDAQASVALNRPVLEGYLAALREVCEHYGVRDDISAMGLARLPEVFQQQKTEEDEQQLLAELLECATQALERFDAMRTTEGRALEADLRERAGTIRALTAQVEERSPQTNAEYRARLEAKLREVLENTAIDEARILTECAIFADKIAVDEETVRLKSHLDQLEGMLDAGGAIGRKLDFLLQELNREANTIGSKASDLAQTRTVVEIKAELEKIREQTQNIE